MSASEEVSAFRISAGASDRLPRSSDYVQLLIAGTLGEAGSVLTEYKKRRRETVAYAGSRLRVVEEIGDFCWYLVRFTEHACPSLFETLALDASQAGARDVAAIPALLDLCRSAAELSNCDTSAPTPELIAATSIVWRHLVQSCASTDISLSEALRSNTKKRESRWPTERKAHPLFDAEYPEEEQLPRTLQIEFREIIGTHRPTVILRCNDLNFGDRLSDNISDGDGYRFHDIFHFAYAAYLGWSPVVRALLRCKRKSNNKVDDAEDGARAAIVEEAVSAAVFSRAKAYSMFEKPDHIDYDLLKTIEGFVTGYEVDSVALWQWEEAIIGGFEIYRRLREHKGGRVSLNLYRRELAYSLPTAR